MFMIMMGTIVIAGIAGNMSEKTGSTHNGYLQLIIICKTLQALLFYFVRYQKGDFRGI